MSNIECTFCGIKIVPTELDFEVEENWPYVPAKQWFKVEREGSGELTPLWDAVVDADWVDLSPTAGRVPKQVLVSVKSIGKPAGIYEAHVTFTSQEALNTPQYATIKLTVKAKPEPPKPLKIITTALPDGKVNETYGCKAEAEGGVMPYIWTCTGLPSGLVFDSQTAWIMGSPTSGGVFPVSINVRDGNNNYCIVDYSLNITKLAVKVAITSPMGGEVWYKGDTHNITWVAENAGEETLDIMLFCDNTWSTLATGVPVASLKYLWTIVVGAGSALVRLVTEDSIVQSGFFAIKEYSKCFLFRSIAKAINFLARKGVG